MKNHTDTWPEISARITGRFRARLATAKGKFGAARIIAEMHDAINVAIRAIPKNERRRWRDRSARFEGRMRIIMESAE